MTQFLLFQEEKAFHNVLMHWNLEFENLKLLRLKYSINCSQDSHKGPECSPQHYLSQCSLCAEEAADEI